MIEIFKNKKYETSEFHPFKEYIELLESSDYVCETVEEECRWTKIKLSKYKEFITILGCKEKDYE